MSFNAIRENKIIAKISESTVILLKTCAYGLSAIFQYSLDKGTLPLDWQNAYVTPVFKKGDQRLAENYRPVSLTSVSCKIMEPIVCSHMLKAA